MTISRIAPLLLLAAPALSLTAQAQQPDPCNTAPQSCATIISTHATAQSRLPNTAVDISVSINAVGRDNPTVQRALAEKSAALLTYLRTQKASRLSTNGVSFSTDTRSQKSGPDKIVGYTGNSEISFRTTPEHAPDLLAGVLDHGASNIDTTNFTPTEEEIAAIRRDLSAEATRTAIAQAEAIAKAASLHLAAVRTIAVEPDASYAPRPFAVNALMKISAGVAAPPIATEAGDQSFSMRVDVTIAATR